MYQFKVTAVASMVTAILASTQVQATEQTRFFNAPSVSSQVQFNPQITQQRALAERRTVSGHDSIFDAQLGKATFLWQAVGQAKPNMSVVLPEQRNAYAADFYLNALTGFSTSKKGTSNAVLADLSKQKSGSVTAKYKQQVHGVEVFNREYNLIMDKEHNLVAGSGYFANTSANTKRSLAPLADFVGAEQSIKQAIKKLADINVSLTKSTEQGDYVKYTVTNQSGDKVVVGQPRAKKVFFEVNGQLESAYYVEVEVADKNSLESDYFSYVIGAKNSKVYFKKDLKAHAADFNYRVWADADGYPWEGPHGDVIPADGPDQTDETEILDAPIVSLSYYSKLSTMDPWLTDDATTTSGNNVFAYADVIAPQGFTEGDFTAETTSDFTFDYPYQVDQVANSYDNRKAAIVNLFYMNNFLHDFFYDHGFDETSNVAQLSNYERGGIEGDPIEAQAQDNSGLDNANMATPADGASPRMQMYLYNSKDAKVGTDFGVVVTSDATIGVLESSKVSGFGQFQFADVTAEVVRLVDGNDTDSGSVFDGCEPATNGAELAGKIALIDRGSCNFTAKVLHAQEVGAIGAIVVNNVPDTDEPAAMGGEDDAVLIPNMGLNFADGHLMYDSISAGNTVTVNMFNNAKLKDGTLDNGIIAHEWGHYISNRLVGNSAGLINFQGRAMGEGWGDFHSLMFIAKADDINITGNDKFQKAYGSGTFVEDFYYGIRRVPYSTNKEVNPLSFRHITENAGADVGISPTSVASPHAAGEIWATMLWESYVALINEHGFEEAQNRMANYLVAGYKLTPIAPLYTEARDAILAAAYAVDTKDYELILGAFAKRGMGLGAVAPDRFSEDLTGVVESDKMELASFNLKDVAIDANYNGAELGFCSNDGIVDKGETATLTVSITNTGSKMLTGTQAQLTVVSDHDVTFENDGLVTFADTMPFSTATSSPLKFTLNESGTAENLEIEVSFPELSADDEIVEAATEKVTYSVNMAFKEKQPVGAQTMDNMEVARASLYDLKENVMIGGDLAKGTQSMAADDNVAFFNSFGFELGEQTMFLQNNDFQSDVAIETKGFDIGFAGDFEVSFWHFYRIENEWDGGVVEISVNGGSWVDVTEMGGTFNRGYDGPLIENDSQAIQERDTFTGNNINQDNVYGNYETINFGSELNGNRAKLRFRLSSDGAVGDLGWWIDNLTFNNVTTPIFSAVIAGDAVACDNAAPIVTVTGELGIKESVTSTLNAVATDRNADELTYAWTQVSGTTATLSNADTAVLSFTPGAITSDEEVVFEVAVSDGTVSVTEQVTVAVSNEAEPVVEKPKSKSSSGSLGFLMLLLTPLAIFGRRRKR
ncbi:rhombosortase-dependent M36 family metallopeptidase [Pseudoalteromonas sp. SR44-5]|uniref:Rhombosortase-dependent M36 family metallopeptidase n=1 Tax=Pseudoalteromonas rhizosphaerae TaxID=2518973 RepID=A0ABW8L016_9GAMM|nr:MULTISPECIES: rhombosortase-dependent M36 family metallopeptidase [unclassified Pseudoalteromonas]MBB1365353.1 rhombosortase-dependent M36 family metallopeptidase [Pseudoalteromonas sp. SR44-5]MBB1416912.1 rhombosortase-dependent M36 family metallopeptidase [Pseudoalteromonas sp. SG44-1]MBB1421504.1 rhombosortase-dependent M36 family metallopeptidase [Pseudoalteromonas sp. SG43-7]MBB1434039.1 rhombosortase-dependent M36 family metallopeptidase [Pseudoalteromonas sp. SG43-6]MBB1468477.1 rhom